MSKYLLSGIVGTLSPGYLINISRELALAQLDHLEGCTFAGHLTNGKCLSEDRGQHVGGVRAADHDQLDGERAEPADLLHALDNLSGVDGAQRVQRRHQNALQRLEAHRARLARRRGEAAARLRYLHPSSVTTAASAGG